MANLTIRSVGPVKVATDNRGYFAVELSAGLGQRSKAVLIFQEFKRDSKTGLPTEELKWTRGTHKQFTDAMNAGEKIEGEIVTKKVAPYEINGRTVDTYTTVVFAGDKAEAVFASANHPMLDEQTGELIGAKAAKTEVKAEAEAVLG